MKEKKHEGILKDLAKYKFKLEGKKSAYKHPFLFDDEYKELSTPLKLHEIKTFSNEYKESRILFDVFQSKIVELADQLSEIEMIRRKILIVSSELKYLNLKLLGMELWKEQRSSKEEAEKEVEGTENWVLVKSQNENSSEVEDLELSQNDETEKDCNTYIKILREDYESLIEKTEKVYQSENQVKTLKKELENATVRIEQLSDEMRKDSNTHIKILREDYEALIKKTEKADQLLLTRVPEYQSQVKYLSTELKNAKARNDELLEQLRRSKVTIAEQRRSRAQIAHKKQHTKF